MGIVQKQGTWNAILSYTGTLLGYINVVLLLPHYFAEEEVGLIRLIMFVAMIYSQVSAFGGPNVAIKFMSYFQSRGVHEGKVIQYLRGASLIAFIPVSCLFFFGQPLLEHLYAENSPLFIEFIFYVVPIAGAILLFDLYEGVLRSIFKSVFPTFLKEVVFRIALSIIIALYVLLDLSIETFLQLFIGIYWLNALAILIYTYTASIFTKTAEKKPFSFQTKKMLAFFGLFSLLSGVTNLILATVDSLMIGSLIGLGEVGIYTTIAFVAVVIVVPARAIYKTTVPLVAKHLNDDNIPELSNLYKMSSRINLVIAIFIYSMLLINFEVLISFLPSQYHVGYYILVFLGAARLVDMATGLNGSIILNSKYYRVDFPFGIFFLGMMVGLNMLFIPEYGINGVAFASFLGVLIFNLVRLLFVYVKFKLFPFNFSSLLIALIGLSAYGIAWLINFEGHMVLLAAVKSLVFSGLFIGTLVMFKLSPEFNDYASKILAIFRRGQVED